MSDYRDSYSLDTTKAKQAIGMLLQAMEDNHAAFKRGTMDAKEYEAEILRLQAAIRKLEDAQKAAATTTTVTTVNANAMAIENVGNASKRSTMAVIEFSRGLQDFAAAGIMGVTNNLQRMAEMFAGGGIRGMGLVLGVTIAGVAMEQLFRRWDELFPKTKEYATGLEELKARLEELEKNPAKVVVDTSMLEAARRQLRQYEDDLAAFNQSAKAPSEIEAIQAAAVREAVMKAGGAEAIRKAVAEAAKKANLPLSDKQLEQEGKMSALLKELADAEIARKIAGAGGVGAAGPAGQNAIWRSEAVKEKINALRQEMEKEYLEATQRFMGGALSGRSSEIETLKRLQRNNPGLFQPGFNAIQDARADRQKQIADEFDRKKRDQQYEDEQQQELERKAGEVAGQVAEAFMAELRKKILAGATDRELRAFVRADLESKGVKAGEASIAAEKMVEDERKRTQAEVMRLRIGGNFPEAQARERVLADARERQAKAQDPDKAEREAEQKKREAERDAAVGKVVGQFDQALGPKARLGILQGGGNAAPAAEAARQIQAQGVEPDLAAEAGRRVAENEQAKLKADFAQRAAAGLTPEQAGAELIGQAQDADRKARGKRTIPQVVDQFDDVLEPQMQAALLQGANPRMLANAAGRQMVRAGVDPQTAFRAGAAMMEQAMQKMEEQHAKAMAAGLSERQATLQLFQMVIRRQGAQEQMSKEMTNQLKQMGQAVRNIQGGIQMQGWGRAPAIWP